MEKDDKNPSPQPQDENPTIDNKTPPPPPDPLPTPTPSHVRENDHVLLRFGDHRRIFAQCTKNSRNQKTPLKINKRSYPTTNLIGLPYGTVLELGPKGLIPLPPGEDLVPEASVLPIVDESSCNNDNRDLIDSNTSQSLPQSQLEAMKGSGASGATIVAALVSHSATFNNKTTYSQAKYIKRKQKKHQPRCRLLRCTGATVCEALFMKDPRRVMNMREDTLAQMLSYGNVYAGCQVLLFEQCLGLLTGALAQRMGGYGKILSIHTTFQPAFTDVINRFNLTFAENNSLKWLPCWDAFPDNTHTNNDDDDDDDDPEGKERDGMEWPCSIQPHTREHISRMTNDDDVISFLDKRQARFARKLTRMSPKEVRSCLRAQSDSLIIATRYDPTETLLPLLPFLAPSCPFVVLCEYIEPLTSCFLELQRRKVAINLRLTDTWYREYQVLEGRTHPTMNMSQSGGFILTGIKLSEEFGNIRIDDDILKKMKEKSGGRRGKKKKKKQDDDSLKVYDIPLPDYCKAKDKDEEVDEAPLAKRVKVN